MIRLQINPAFVDLLRSRNLHGYHQVMQTSLGEVIEENNLRDIRCLDLDGVKLYLKRTRSEKASSAFESYCRGKLPHSRPYKEMMLLRLLKQLDFDVAEKNLEAADSGIDEARENVRTTELAFSHGRATTTDVLNSIDSLTRAERNVINARMDLILTDFRVKRMVEDFRY